MATRPTHDEKRELRVTGDASDKRIFRLDADQWKEFLTALDAPPRPLLRLQRLFMEPGFFDSKT